MARRSTPSHIRTGHALAGTQWHTQLADPLSWLDNWIPRRSVTDCWPKNLLRRTKRHHPHRAFALWVAACADATAVDGRRFFFFFDLRRISLLFFGLLLDLMDNPSGVPINRKAEGRMGRRVWQIALSPKGAGHCGARKLRSECNKENQIDCWWFGTNGNRLDRSAGQLPVK